jgi:hypothetical protein
MNRLAAGFVVAMLLTACVSPTPSPSLAAPTAHPVDSPLGTPLPVTPQPTSTPPAATPLAETDVCVAAPLKSVYIGLDPCPPAIAAVHEAVVPLGLAITRLVVQPGFFCGLWPSVSSPAVCFGPIYAPGTAMHGWVSFTGSDKVAAVSVRLQGALEPSPPPSPLWVATIEALQVPPAGWVMPVVAGRLLGWSGWT